MKNNRINKTNRTIRNLKFFKQSEARTPGNLIAPVNDFPVFAKEEFQYSISARFESQVEKYPDKAAIKAGACTLTYKELDGFANRVAWEILETYDDRYRISQKEKIRYSRQMMLHGWGIESQEKLKGVTVFAAGAGGSGSPLIMQLALAGFGTIIICDHDDVDLSNLNRQMLHDETRIGMNKALSAKMTIQRINPHVNVIAYPEKITRENVSTLVGNAQIIFDNVDDLEAKFILSECAVHKQIPHILSSMIDLNAYAVVLAPPRTPCFHCLYDRKVLQEIEVIKSQVTNYQREPNPAASPSLFLSTGFVVNEAIKILLGLGKPAYNKYILFNQRETAEIIHTDGYLRLIYPFTRHFKELSRRQGFDWEKGWTGNLVEIIQIEPDPHCPHCSKNPEKNYLPLSSCWENQDSSDNSVSQPQERKGNPKPQTVALLFGQGIEMVVGIMGVLKAGKTYVPLDPSYPRERLQYMLDDSESRLVVTDDTNKKLAEQIRDKVNKNLGIVNINQIDGEKNPGNPGIQIEPGSLAYILYTSGSTGKPKGVMQNHRNVLHFARVYTNALHLHAGDRLTLFSTYGFDAAKMDIFGALLNGASLYPYDIKQEGSLLHLPLWLQKERITVFHSIPTLYRYFIDNLTRGDSEKGFPDLRFIVMGGEPVFKKDVDHYKKYFPDECLFINGLGPTESTVTLQYFINKETEISKEAVPVGYPVEETEVFLINEKGEEARVYEVGEILYKSDYLALGYWHNSHQSEEAFKKDTISGGGRVYYSGDLGRRLPEGSIEYVGRKDFQVKVRGYRIELAEIEGCLDQMKGIRKSVVVCRQDPGGEACLTAYYQEEAGIKVNENNLAQQLRERIPDYMIPAAFYRLKEFPLTATGKIDRKALADAALSGNLMLDRVAYAPPRNPVEEKLVEIWAEILKVESPSSIGIHDNFFVLGGHSLKAVILASAVHRHLNVKISLADIFKFPTIRELSGFIKDAVENKYASLQAAEKKEYYALSSPQKRLFIIQQTDKKSIAYNLPQVIELEEKLPKEKLEKIIKKLIRRHDSLRTSFLSINGEPAQKIHDEVTFEIEWLTAAAAKDNQQTGNIHERVLDAADFIRPFDLSQAPLLKIRVMEVEDKKHLLMVDKHHIISDAVSNQVLTRDFMALYKGEIEEERESLPPLRLQYKDYSEWFNRELRKDRGAIKQQEAFWLKIFRGRLPKLNLPMDYARPAVKGMEGDRIIFTVGEKETKKMKTLALEENATLYMVVLAIYTIFLSKLSAQEDIIVGTPTAGRRHSDLEQIIGMFVSTLALRNYPTAAQTFNTFLREVRQRTLDAMENQDYPFEDLLQKIAVTRDPARNPLFDVFFQLSSFPVEPLNQSNLEISPIPGLHSHYRIRTSKFDLYLYGEELGGSLRFSLESDSQLFKLETLKMFIKNFQEIVSQIVKNTEIKLEDITITNDIYDKKIDIPETGFAF